MLTNDPAPTAGLSKQAVTAGHRNTRAEDLEPGMKIFDVQIEGERIARKTPAVIERVWTHGPCITTLTRRGYVEYSADEFVKVVK
jgi:hypothetical protein